MYEIHYDTNAKTGDYVPRGGAKELFYCKDPEIIIHGAAETGKTLALCWLLHITHSKYPNLHSSIVRKTQHSVYGSVLQTFQRVIAGSPVKAYGGEKPERYIYPNGSTIWIGGMDNPDKILSSERYIIAAVQCEEFTLNDWEMLTTRATGRGFSIPHARVIGDANPAGSKHWIRQRKNLTLIQSRHEDNPTLYDDNGQLTAQGKITFSRLDNLTGVRLKRLRHGIWATAEGAVYDTFDSSVHIKTRPKEEFKEWYLTVDVGYTNPAVILLVGSDTDGRWHIAKEFYERGVRPERHAEIIKEWYYEHKPSLIVVDAAAAGFIATLNNMGVPAIGGKGDVEYGIGRILDRLKVQGDGLPRITVEPGVDNTINEFESYERQKTKDGVNKEAPKKENDHAMDAIRYLEDAIGDNTPFKAEYVDI